MVPGSARISLRTAPGVVHAAVGVEHDIADLAIRLQILRRDVHAVARKDIVQAPKLAGQVPMHLDEARAGRARRQLHLREIHGALRRAHVGIFDQLARHLRADALLRLQRRAADMRRKDDVVEALQRRTKRSALDFGSTGNTSTAAPARCLSFSARASASTSYTVPRALLMKYAPGFIARNCASPIMPLVSGVSGTCRLTTSLAASNSSSVSLGSVLPWRSLSVRS